MAYKDLRQFIQRLEQEGEITNVDAEVDWDLEIGAISRQAIDRRSGALLFNHIRGCLPGHRVMANILGPSQPIHAVLALALGLPKDTHLLGLIDWFASKFGEQIRPMLVDRAPCKENILRGDDINLLQFPVPRIHGIDAGRYIGTWHIDIIKDPDTGWVNWGMYRHQLHDERRIGWLASPSQHGPSIYYEKYESKGKPMPMAMVIGSDPLSSIVAGVGVPSQTNEVDVIGGMQGEPVELVRCETIDLEVPASAEIVIEGHVIPNERIMEGPFGEFTGYSSGGRVARPVFIAECVTFRNNPIMTMSNMGKPWDEVSILNSVAGSAMLSRELRSCGIPFRGVYCPPPTLACIVAAKPQYAGFIHSVASTVWASKSGSGRPYVFLVGEDVDPTNMDEVFWCLTSRLHPSTGIHIQNGAPCTSLFPPLSRAERGASRGARVAFDATFPPDWPKEEIPQIIDFENGWPAETQEKVLSRWKEYGIK